MGFGLQLLRQHAVERCDGILQHGRARRADSPSSEGEAIVAVNALLTAESECEQRMLLVEEIDHEMALLADARVCACVPVDADEE